MSLRDIYGNNNDTPVVLNTEPLGNGSGLGDFHTINPEEREPNNMPKIIGGVAVALMIGAASGYLYLATGSSSAVPAVKPITTAQNIPPAPANPTPAADTSTTTDNSAMTTPAAAPAAPVAAPAPVKTAEIKPVESKPVKTKIAKAETSSSDLGAANARMAADANAPATPAAQSSVMAPTQTAAVPEPVSPTAPSSSVASNAQPTAPEAAQPAQQPVEQAQPQVPAQGNETGAAAPAAAQPAPAQPQQ